MYLRNNYINEIRGLNSLVNLKVLNLQYNMIYKNKNISHLINLEDLDISENDIYDFDCKQFPENLIDLYFIIIHFLNNIIKIKFSSIILK